MRDFDIDGGTVEFVRDRELAMTKEEIEKINDIQLLLDKGDKYAEISIIIDTTLTFPDDKNDREWFIRARAALIAFRVAKYRIEKRVKQLQREESQRKAALRAAAVMKPTQWAA